MSKMATALPKDIEDVSLLGHAEAVSQVNPLILRKTGPFAANTDLLSHRS